MAGEPPAGSGPSTEEFSLSVVVQPAHRLGRFELTALLAMSMALAALGIDLLLPAFPAVRQDLGLPSDSTAVAGLVTAYFVGLALGQLAYGPITDRFGRRGTLLVSFAIYGLGALMATLAPTLPLLFAARFVWGVGAAGPRVVCMAVIRDLFEGEAMSRAMSFVMAVFILVPVVAPALGAAVVAVAPWRWVFGVCALAVLVMLPWGRRLPETLAVENRRPLRLRPIAQAAAIVVSNRRTVAYGLAMTSLYGGFTSYLASSEIIFGETFDQQEAFPLLFGGLAVVMGAAMLLNARVVGRLGTRRLAHGVLLAYVAVAVLLLGAALLTGGRPPLAVFLVGMGALLACQALLIPNLNTIAMAPMAQVAGTAASVIGAVQVAGGAVLGSVLDRTFDGTIRPLTVGFVAYGLVALGLIVWCERGRLFTGAGLPGVEPGA